MNSDYSTLHSRSWDLYINVFSKNKNEMFKHNNAYSFCISVSVFNAVKAITEPAHTPTIDHSSFLNVAVTDCIAFWLLRQQKNHSERWEHLPV